jgi:DNA-binding transcriptional ArsR family regulator
MYTHPHLRQTALVHRALGNERRLHILELLKTEPRTNKELTAKLRIHSTATSKHLRTLRLAKLIEGERKGQSVFFRIVRK